LIIHAEQIRAARSLLGWSQDELAKRASVGQMTVKRFEAGVGPVSGTIGTLVHIQSALERAGIQFIPADEYGSVGVRLIQKPKTMK
jgi:transcriptional regulator with XRE-family HTH domain